MADVGEERGLGPIDLGERLGAAAFLFVGFGIGDRRGDLAGDQFHETGIVVVEQAKRVEAGDENAGASGFAARHDRQHDGAVRAPAARPRSERLPGIHFQIITIFGLVLGELPRRAATGASSIDDAGQR